MKKSLKLIFTLLFGIFPISSFAEKGHDNHEFKRDFSTVMQGSRLYQQQCAVCHGEQAQGNPAWRTRGSNGILLPPPLNGSGHTWHHPLDLLRQTVLQGGIPTGGSMPAFKGKLKTAEIDAIIAWIQSRWPEEIFKNWEKTNQGTQHKH